MDRHTIELALAETVEHLCAQGDSWWPGTEVAPIAYRRLQSFARRHRSTSPTEEQRVADLAKGLKAHFEPTVPCTHPNDWHALAAAIVTAYRQQTSSADG